MLPGGWRFMPATGVRLQEFDKIPHCASIDSRVVEISAIGNLPEGVAMPALPRMHGDTPR